MSITDFDAPPIDGQQDLDGNEHVSDDIAPEEIRIGGTTQLGLGSSKGGKAPSRSTISIAGVKGGLIDQAAFDKGEIVKFEVTARIDRVAEEDKVDKPSGVVMECVQVHTATCLDVRLLS